MSEDRLYNVLTDTEDGRIIIVDGQLERPHALFLRTWHNETIGNRFHWVELHTHTSHDSTTCEGCSECLQPINEHYIPEQRHLGYITPNRRFTL